MHKVMVLNGPNLNLLGQRQPEIYGSTTYSELEQLVTEWGAQLDLAVSSFQSNHEGELIDKIQEVKQQGYFGLVLNLGALSHTSYALADAVTSVGLPTVEIHISNVMRREPFRRQLLMVAVCMDSIFGRGIEGYRWAIRRIKSETVHRSQRRSYHQGVSLDEPIRNWANLNKFHRKYPVTFRQPVQTSREPVPIIALIAKQINQECWGADTLDWIAARLSQIGYPSYNFGLRLDGTSYGDLFTFAEAFIHQAAAHQPVVWVGHQDSGAQIASALDQLLQRETHSLVWLGADEEIEERGRLFLKGEVASSDSQRENVGFDPELDPFGPSWDQLISWLSQHRPLPHST